MKPSKDADLATTLSAMNAARGTLARRVEALEVENIRLRTAVAHLLNAILITMPVTPSAALHVQKMTEMARAELIQGGA